MEWLLPLFAFAFGAIIGSFLNVVIHRYPAGESLVAPRSYCPHCHAQVRAYDNVPILSWLLLRGRCRSCLNPISVRYPMVELSNALFYLAAFLHTGLSVGFLLLAAIVSMTILLIYIDLDIQILPDIIDLPGIAVGFVIGVVKMGTVYPNLILSTTLLDSAIGAVVGAGTLLAIAALYRLIRKIEGMGTGDVKMLAMIGATVGWRPLLPLLFLASLSGAILGLILAGRSSQGLRLAIPFGVFLGLATLAMIFAGNLMADLYLRLLIR